MEVQRETSMGRLLDKSKATQKVTRTALVWESQTETLKAWRLVWCSVLL